MHTVHGAMISSTMDGFMSHLHMLLTRQKTCMIENRQRSLTMKDHFFRQHLLFSNTDPPDEVICTSNFFFPGKQSLKNALVHVRVCKVADHPPWKEATFLWHKSSCEGGGQLYFKLYIKKKSAYHLSRLDFLKTIVDFMAASVALLRLAVVRRTHTS